MRTKRVFPLVSLIIASVLTVFLLSIVSSRSQAAVDEGSAHKVIAESGVLSADQAGVALWHDYGSFALYRVSDAALAEMPTAVRDQVRVADEMDRILFDAYPFDTQRETLDIPSSLSISDPQGEALHLIQFVGPIKAEWLTAVAAAGATPVHYVANNAYLVWTDDAGRDNLARLAGEGDFLQYAAPYQPYFKLGQSLRERDLSSAEVAPVTIQIYDHPDNAATQALIAELAVDSKPDWSRILAYQNAQVNVHVNDLEALANAPDVYWIGERFERELYDEVQNQIVAGNFNGDQSGPSGTGYLAWLDSFGFSQDPADYPVVDITDDGIGDGTVNSGDPTLHEFGDTNNATRLAFVSNCTDASSGEGVDGHGHINTSIVGGYDQRAGFPFQDPDGYFRGLGVNPYGQIAGTRIFDLAGFDLSSCGGTDTGLIESSYTDGARISSNSWGCSGCAGTYDDSSQAFDVGTRDADLNASGNQELMFVFAAGNSGSGSGTVGTPGNGKNMLTVGASENQRPDDEDGSWTDGCLVGPTGADDAMDVIDFSSRGPAPGDRVKPEVIAPGTHIQGTASTNAGYTGNSVCDQYRPSGQTTFAASSGTSHSTPAVAGVSSLIYYWLQNEQAVDGEGAGYEPSPAVLKAYAMAHPTYLTGVDGSDTLPSNNQGYGMPNMGLMFGPTPKYVLDQSVIFDNSGETWTWSGAVADPSEPVRIMLNYTDKAGAIGTSPQVNDLNLEVTVGGTTYIGNNFSGQWSVTGGSADAANNYEAVFLPAGTTGSVEIEVTGFNIADDGVPNIGDTTDQDFALVCYNCAQDPDFTIQASPTSQDICTPADASYDVVVGSILGYSAQVTLAAQGHPAGTTASFADNPVTSPFTTSLTIGNTGAASFGSYGIDVIGMGPTSTHTATVNLGVYTATPVSPTLDAPADGATGVDLVPTFEWSAPTQGQNYFLEVAEDSAFNTVVYSTTVAGASATPNIALDPLTTYYWRVTPSNICGAGVTSAVYSFETREVPPILVVDDDDNDPDVRSFYTDALDDLGAEYDVWDTGNSDNEPSETDLLPYTTVIWFTGDEFGGAAGPGSAGETALSTWLDSGSKCMFLSSQDYHYDRGQTAFMSDYLGVDSVANDSGDFASVDGQGTVFGGYGPYALDYSPVGSDYADEVAPDTTAELAFMGGNGKNAAVNKDAGAYRTTFWGFAYEAIGDSVDRAEVMDVILNWCGADTTTGILTGAVDDADTGMGIEGATILADNGSNQRTTTTNANGVYTMTLAVGTYDVTATAANYISDTVTSITIVTDTVTIQDFTLQGSSLYYDPGSIEESMEVGEIVTNTVTVTNTGPLDVDWSVSIANYNGPMQITLSDVSVPASDGDFPRGTAAPSLERAPASAEKLAEVGNATGPAPLIPTASQAYGVNLLGDDFDTFTVDDPGNLTNIAAATGDFYAGDFLSGNFSTLYAIDNATQTLYGISTADGTATAIGAPTPSGGQSWSGMAGDPTSGTMYAWSTDCAANTLYTLDVSSGAVTTVGTSSGVCVIDIAVNASGDMYGLDILTDDLVSIDKTTGAVTAIGSVGFDANFAQGMDFDEATGTLYLAAYNNATSAAELRIADTSTGASTVVGAIGPGGGVEFDAFAIAAGGGAGGWASATPDSGSIPAGSTATFNVVFNANGLSQEGTYTADLGFSGTYVNMVPDMPLTMHLTCPTCGYLGGAITDDATGDPLTADIFITDNAGFDLSLSGDSYNVSVPAGNYDITASASGYFSQTASVSVSTGMTTTTDFALTPVVGLLDYAPALLEQDLAIGEFATHTLVLTNPGTISVDFSLNDRETGNPLDMAPTAPTTTCPPDAFGYTCIDSNEADGPAFEWIDISGTGADMGLGDDSHFFPIDLPFDFDFYGMVTDTIAVGSNGTVYFEDVYLGFSNTGIPDSNSYGVDSFIAVYWDDLNPDSAGAVYYEIVGEAPFRKLIVQWDQVPNFGTSDPITAQAILFETTNNILVQYLDPSSEAGSGATEGIQGDPTTGLQYGYDESILTEELAVCYVPPGSPDPNCSGGADAEWLHQVPMTGTLDAGMSYPVDIVFDATAITQTGTYTAEINFGGTFENEVAPATAIMHVSDPAPEITLDVTLSTDGSCGAVDEISVSPHATVYYCYTVENIGNMMLPTHVISDSVFGEMGSFAFDLYPGMIESVIYTQTMTSDVTSTATWRASHDDMGMYAQASDTVTVTMEDYMILMPAIMRP